MRRATAELDLPPLRPPQSLAARRRRRRSLDFARSAALWALFALAGVVLTVHAMGRPSRAPVASVASQAR
jgi:hypothetical protein